MFPKIVVREIRILAQKLSQIPKTLQCALWLIFVSFCSIAKLFGVHWGHTCIYHEKYTDFRFSDFQISNKLSGRCDWWVPLAQVDQLSCDQQEGCRTLRFWVANKGLLGFDTGHALAALKVTNRFVLQGKRAYMELFQVFSLKWSIWVRS